MEGLAADMTEEDVRSSLPTLPQPFDQWCNHLNLRLGT